MDDQHESLPSRLHNQPPLPERLASDYLPLAAEIQALAARANAAPIEVQDDAEQGIIGNLAKDVSKTRKNAEARRVDEKEPFLQGGRQVDGFFQPMIARLDKISEAMELRGREYLDAKADRERQVRDIERRKREAEERARREEADRLLREAEAREREAREASARAERERLAAEQRERDAVAARERAEREAREAEARHQREIEAARNNAEREKLRVAEMARLAQEELERNQRREEERRAADAKAKADMEALRRQREEDRAAQAALDEAARADEEARRAEQATMEAERAANAKASDMARTRSSGSLSTLRSGFDFDVTDWDALDLDALRPYLPRPDIEKAIRAFVRTHKDTKPIKGVRIFQTTKAEYR